MCDGGGSPRFRLSFSDRVVAMPAMFPTILSPFHPPLLLFKYKRYATQRLRAGLVLPGKRSKREQGKRDNEAAEEAAKYEVNENAVWTGEARLETGSL